MEAWDSGPVEIHIVSADQAVRAHPGIRQFVALCNDTRGEDVLTFEAVEGPAFMPYWKNLGILRWDESRGDFVFVYYGTEVATMVGADYTGKDFSDGGPAGAEIARQIHRRALFKRRTVYFCGSLGWRNRSFASYVGVALPLRRGNTLNETVSCLFAL